MATPMKRMESKHRELKDNAAHRQPKLVATSKKAGASLGNLKLEIEEPLRGSYFDSVRAIADGLAARFIRHDFDENYDEDSGPLSRERQKGECRFLDLEEVVDDMPICAERDSAHIVVLVSPHAQDAFSQISEATPEGDRMLQSLAAKCLAEDLCDEAARRGWHTKGERGERAGLVHAREVTAWNKAGCKGPMPKLLKEPIDEQQQIPVGSRWRRGETRLYVVEWVKPNLIGYRMVNTSKGQSYESPPSHFIGPGSVMVRVAEKGGR